ncbi:hypothetical protein PVAG01_01310 [Phlyctema vagabunda]|uniref:Uncharacterized protein n=1 Tax=Phlyctema vagabunda TaxID=108571 RepID=A0ABR4PWT4_9HELO
MQHLKQYVQSYLPRRNRKPSNTQGLITGLDDLPSAPPPRQPRTSLRGNVISHLLSYSPSLPKLRRGTKRERAEFVLLDPPLSPRAFKFPCRAWGHEEDCHRCRERDEKKICQSPMNAANPASVPPEVYRPCIVSKEDLISPPVVNYPLRSFVLSQQTGQDSSSRNEDEISIQSEESLVEIRLVDRNTSAKSLGESIDGKSQDDSWEAVYPFPSSLKDSAYLQVVSETAPRVSTFSPTLKLGGGGQFSSLSFLPFFSPDKKKSESVSVERGKEMLEGKMGRMDWFLALQHGKGEPMTWREFGTGTKKMLKRKEAMRIKIKEEKIAKEQAKAKT